MNVLYFAWLRERIGVSSETLSPPDSVKTAADFVQWLCQQAPHYAAAFTDLQSIQVAIDQTQANFEDSIESAQEIAFFPPVTGG